MSSDRTEQALARSWHHLQESATQYENVAFTDGVFRPTKPFKMVQVGGAGHLEIEDLRGKRVVLTTVTAGDHWYAGRAIHSAGTTATNITVAY